MRAILIDPAKQTVTEVDYDGDYQSIYKLTDCTTFAVPYVLENEDALYVDDEGLLNGPVNFFTIWGYPEPLAGKCLILGTDEDGKSVAAKSMIEDLDVRFVIPIQFPDHMEWLRVA